MPRWLIITFAGLTVLIGGVLAAPSFVDWNAYRGDIQDMVREKTGRDITIKGNLSFNILPSPALSVADVSLANFAGGTASRMVELKSLDINVSLLPLLKGKADVKSLSLVGARIYLERDSDGVPNWVFGDAASEDAPVSKKDDALSLNYFMIEDGFVSYRDATTGLYEEVINVNAELSLKSSKGPFGGRGSLAFRGVPLEFDGVVGWLGAGRKASMKFSAVPDGVTPGVSAHGSLQEVPSGYAFQGSVNASGNDMGRFINALNQLGGGEALVARTPGHDFELKTELDAAPGAFATRNMTVALGKGKGEAGITWFEPIEGPGKATVRLALDQFDSGPWLRPDAGKDVRNSFVLPTNLNADLDVEIAQIHHNEGLAQQVVLSGHLEQGVFEVSRGKAMLPGEADILLSGTLKPKQGRFGFDGKVKASARNLRETMRWAGVDVASVPKGRLEAFSIDGGLVHTGHLVGFENARGQLDVSRFNGSYMRSLNGQYHSAYLSLNRLDVNDYVVIKKAGKKAKTDDPLEWLKTFDGDLNLSVNRLQVDGQKGLDVKIVAALKDGVLKLKRASADEFAGVSGHVDGQLQSVKGLSSYDLNVDVEAKSIAPLQKWLAFDLPYSSENISSISAKGAVKGGVRDVSLDLEGIAFRGRYDIQGQYSKADRRMDAAFDISHPSHNDLLKRLGHDGLIMGEAGSFSAKGTAKGDAQLVTFMTRIAVLQGQLNANGTVSDPWGTPKLSGEMDITHPNAHALLTILDNAFAQSKNDMGPVAVRLRLDASENKFSLPEFSGKIGSLDLKGTAKIDRSGARPVANGDVEFDHVLLDHFLPANGAGAIEAHHNNAKRWSERPLNFAFIRDWDGAFDIKAKRLTYGTYDFSSPRIAMTLKDGALSTSHASAGLMGGKAHTNMTINATGVPSLSATIGLKGASVERALNDVAAIKPATGTFDLEGTFAAKGTTQKAMISSLSGKGQMVATQGVIRGFDMEKLSLRLGELSQLSDFARLVGTALSKGQTPYKRLVVGLAAENGVVDATLLEADMTATNLDAKARIDLPNWVLDVDGAMKLMEPQAAPAVGVKVAGPVSAPQIDYRTAALKAYMKQKLAEALLKELLNKPAVVEPASPQPESGVPLSEGAASPQAPEPSPEDLMKKGLSFLLKKAVKQPKPPEPS